MAIPRCKDDTGWIQLNIHSSCIDYFEHRQDVEVKIRRLDKIVKIVGQLKSKQIISKELGYRLFDIPQQFKANPPYEVKHSTTLLYNDKGNGNIIEIPCYIYINWKHEFIQLQIYNDAPLGSVVHLDFTYLL